MLATGAGKRLQSTVLVRKAAAELLKWTTDEEKPDQASKGRKLIRTFVSREQTKRLLQSLRAESLLLDGDSFDDWLAEHPVFSAFLWGSAGPGNCTLLR
jgi:hypothetical protein